MSFWIGQKWIEGNQNPHEFFTYVSTVARRLFSRNKKSPSFWRLSRPKCFYNWCFGVWWFMIWKPILLEQWHLDTAGAVPAVNLNCTLQFVRSPILPRHLSNAWKKTQLFRYFTTCGTATNLSSPSHPIGSLEKKMAASTSWHLAEMFCPFQLSLPRDESSKWPAGWKNAARNFPAFLSQLNGT